MNRTLKSSCLLSGDVRASLIVAGGRSTRFGEADKAVAPLGGVPMIRRVANRTTGVVDELVVNCRDDQRAAIENALSDLSVSPSFRIDEEPDQGPMAGIGIGLRDVTARYTFVVGCDMPFVEPPVVEALFDRAPGTEAVVPQYDAYPQPLHAVYHTEAMQAACETARAAGDRRIVAALDRLDHETVPWAELDHLGTPTTFENLNTREEFDAAHDRFAEDQHG